MRNISEICDWIGETGGSMFRPWSVDDASTLVDAWTDVEIARWNPVPPEPSLALAEQWIRSTSTQNEASVGIDVVAVRGGVVVGEVGLQIDPAQSIGEIGFWVADGHRGSGTGRSHLAFAEKLASELDLRGLVALVDPENVAATALLMAAGWPEVPTKSQRRAFAFRVPVA